MSFRIGRACRFEENESVTYVFASHENYLDRATEKSKALKSCYYSDLSVNKAVDRAPSEKALFSTE